MTMCMHCRLLSLADNGSELLHTLSPAGTQAVGSDVKHLQTLDERLDMAMSTLAAAEERLSLADHDGMLLMQQRDEALHRCALPWNPHHSRAMNCSVQLHLTV